MNMRTSRREVAKNTIRFRDIEEIKGWRGAIDRFTAEELLKESPVGTYLLREADPCMRPNQEHLAASNREFVKLFVCTFVEKREKISDVLIVCTERGWTLYRDNPDLFDAEYRYVTSPQAVLSDLHKRAKHPLNL